MLYMNMQMLLNEALNVMAALDGPYQHHYHV